MLEQKLYTKAPRHIRAVESDELLYHEIGKILRDEEVLGGVPPETASAMIYCYECDLPSQHEFKGRRAVRNSSGNIIYQEQVYSCCHCHFQRVWGTETSEG